MTISTRLLGLIMTAALLLSSIALAEDLPTPDTGDMSPIDLSLPSSEDGGMPMMSGDESGESSFMTGQGPTDIDAFRDYDTYDAGPNNWWGDQFAPIESTGTWLRRGFWYAEVDGVVWNRLWNRDSKFLAAQDINVTSPNFFPNTPVFQPPIFSTNRLLMLDGAQPGEDGSVRATLGKFLFRDQRNRDHTVEFTAFGGGDWTQQRILSSENNFGLFVPFYIDGGNRSFNQSTHQQVSYASHYSSFELNYHVKQRMQRDQLVMDPNGGWHRSANAGLSKEYLAGLRMMELKETLDWTAQDIQQLGDDGSYNIRTDNDLVGFQMGTGFAYDASRFSVGTHARGGVYVNDAKGRTTLNFTADDTGDSDNHMANDELSFIGEFRVTGRWHLTPSFSLRASYELMYITAVALAPSQATFITDFAYLNTSGDPFYHGASFGFEGYW